MNKKLYILAAGILIAISLNLISQFSDFSAGFSRGRQEAAEGFEIQSLIIALRPVQMSDKPTQLYNEHTEEWMPGRIRECVIYVEKYKENLLYILADSFMLFLSVLCLPALIVISVCFVKLIHAVSKNEIFEWKNVRRLRFLGGGFLVLFLLMVFAGLYNYIAAKDLVEIPGYKINFGYMLDLSYLLFGIFSLVIAEIAAIGLRLKEEEELTI